MINEKETQILKRFSDLLAAMLTVIAESVQQQKNDTLLKVLIDLSENAPKYLRLQLLPIFEMCMKIFNDPNTLDSRRQPLETVVTLAEIAPAMVRKNAEKYIVQLVPLVLQIMADLEEERWAEQDEFLDEDNDCNNVVEAALDGLDGKIILPLMTQSIPAMLDSTDWKQRHAALMALSTIEEGCNKQMETN